MGTLLLPGTSATQRMVVIAQQVVTIEPELSVEVELDVACAQMERDQPGSDDGFRVSATAVGSTLLKLLRAPSFAGETFRVRQFAIWTVTDNPSRSGYVGLGFITGSGPSSVELARIKALFREAGIPPGHYRALQ